MPHNSNEHGVSIEYWRKPYSSLGLALAQVVGLSTDKHLDFFRVSEEYDVVGNSFVAHIVPGKHIEIAAWALSPALLLQEGFILEE